MTVGFVTAQKCHSRADGDQDPPTCGPISVRYYLGDMAREKDHFYGRPSEPRLIPQIRGVRAPASNPTLSPSRRLAAELHDQLPTTKAAEWLITVMQGRDPDAPVDDKTGRPRGGTPPDWTTRRWAAAIYFDRAYGKLKSHVVLEQESRFDLKIAADVSIAAFSLDAPTMAKVLGPKLSEFRDMQRKLITEAKRKRDELALQAAGVSATASPEDVIDVGDE